MEEPKVQIHFKGKQPFTDQSGYTWKVDETREFSAAEGARLKADTVHFEVGKAPAAPMTPSAPKK
jgi:hypothetical protein